MVYQFTEIAQGISKELNAAMNDLCIEVKNYFIFSTTFLDQLPSYLTISDQPSDVLNSLIEKWQPDHVAVLVEYNLFYFARTRCRMLWYT